MKRQIDDFKFYEDTIWVLSEGELFYKTEHTEWEPCMALPPRPWWFLFRGLAWLVQLVGVFTIVCFAAVAVRVAIELVSR